MQSASAFAPEQQLAITRVFDAPRALVFKAWTDPKSAIHWWGPREHPATYLDMDVRVGGAWRHCLTSKDTGKDLWAGGIFHEIEPPERLVFTFAWDEEGERGIETLVTVMFADQGGKTKMTFHQAPFQSVAERDGHIDGWSSMFDRFDEQFKTARENAS